MCLQIHFMPFLALLQVVGRQGMKRIGVTPVKYISRPPSKWLPVRYIQWVALVRDQRVRRKKQPGYLYFSTVCAHTHTLSLFPLLLLSLSFSQVMTMWSIWLKLPQDSPPFSSYTSLGSPTVVPVPARRPHSWALVMPPSPHVIPRGDSGFLLLLITKLLQCTLFGFSTLLTPCFTVASHWTISLFFSWVDWEDFIWHIRVLPFPTFPQNR